MPISLPISATTRRGFRVLLVGLIVTLALFLLVGCSQNLSAPADLSSGWTTTQAWAIDQSNPQAIKNATAQRAESDIDQQQLSSDFAGAQALVEWYQFNDLQLITELRAVRAQAPTYFVTAAESDAARLSVPLAPREVQHFGSVSCDVTHTSISDIAEVAENTSVQCMRTSKNLTIWIGPMTGLPKTVVDLVNDAWKKLGGTSAAPVPWPATARAETPIVLPKAIGPDYRPKAEILLPESAAEKFATYATEDGRALSTLFNAPAAAAGYTNPSYDSSFQIYAVRTESPSPYVQYLDPKRLGSIAPINEKITIGKVECLVRNNVVRAGGDKAELMPKVQWCERSDKGTTVRIFDVSGDLQLDLNSVAQMVDTVWGTVAS